MFGAKVRTVFWTGRIALAREHPVTEFEHYPVSTLVNNAKNEGADLIEPFASPV